MRLAGVRACDPGQPLGRLLFYRLCWFLSRIGLILVYRMRIVHPERVPARGGLLVVSNHQSHLDAPVVGVALRGRHIVPIARMGLFKNRVFGWLIGMLNAIPINEKEGDAVAIRKAIKELGHGRCILIFPEGSRTPDGRLQEFKRGTWLLIARSNCAVLPAAVEGLYDAWPRARTLPRLWRQRAGVAFGEALDHDRLISMGADEGLAFLAERIEELRNEAGKIVGVTPRR
jgi:1-acyl-sn-glycerol-3-phosphate acyltransferase